MIRIKQKKAKKQKASKAQISNDKSIQKESKALKKSKAKLEAQQDVKPKKLKNLLLRKNDFDEADQEEDSPFPITIDLQKHIKLAPKSDSRLQLSKDSVDMIKQSDAGMFDSISGMLNRGDEELGIDELLAKKQKAKTKAFSGLPGWGNWANTRTISQPVDERPKIRAEERKRKRVHIAEEPKNNYQVQEVPFPFTSVADYESSIRTNFSQEFNSRRVHQILSKSKKKVDMELEEC
ncbi:uncharacterized protein LOC134827625 [Culicoides brevitarsis]|uniref:uncharacterized protein LOC134827625 n=1 Tax=Culicoides brevitarsis TaxID=469753 RepID=UPI00307C07C8